MTRDQGRHRCGRIYTEGYLYIYITCLCCCEHTTWFAQEIAVGVRQQLRAVQVKRAGPARLVHKLIIPPDHMRNGFGVKYYVANRVVRPSSASAYITSFRMDFATARPEPALCVASIPSRCLCRARAVSSRTSA